MLSGLTEETTFLAGREYSLPRGIAERYYDHGIVEIVDSSWEARPARGIDELAVPLQTTETATAAVPTETAAAPAMTEEAAPKTAKPAPRRGGTK
jgi:hypothetical protein